MADAPKIIVTYSLVLIFKFLATSGQTTQQIPTTPVPLPQGSPTDVPVNTDIGICTCDLTGNSCDPNCCCDQDCSSNDISAFSKCDNVLQKSSDSQLCLQNVVMFNNSQTTPSIFCVEYDNYKSRNYWKIASQVSSLTQLNEYIDQYADPTYQSTSRTTVYPDTYKTGDPIYTIFSSNAVGKLGLPKSSTGTMVCDDLNPISYLYDATNSCVRTVSNLATQCATSPALSAATYYLGFKVVKSPALFKSGIINTTATAAPTQAIVTNPNATTAVPPTTTVPPLYEDGYLVAVTLASPVICLDVYGIESECNITGITTIPTPAYYAATGVCENIVKEVEYIITHNISEGIVSVEIKLKLASAVAKDNFPWSQMFKVSFLKDGTTNAVMRSGNPGYVVGKPILAGELALTTRTQDGVQPTVQSISLSSDSTQWLTVVKSSAAGQCVNDSSSRVAINFGENLRTGCIVRVSLSNLSSVCDLIQATTREAMFGGITVTDTASNMYIGTFGNSDPQKVGDWVNILVENKFEEVTYDKGVCKSLKLDIHLEIVYSNHGSLANPQPKILGAVYKLGPSQDIPFQCSGPYCQTGSEDLSQAIEVTSSVSFVDVSQSAIAVESERPSFTTKLPYDFFYPFLSDSPCMKSQMIVLIGICILPFLL